MLKGGGNENGIKINRSNEQNKKNLNVQHTFFSKGRTIRKVMGGGGNQENNACKGKDNDNESRFHC